MTNEELADLIVANMTKINELTDVLEMNVEIDRKLVDTLKTHKKSIEVLSERVAVLEEESMYRALMSQAGSSH